MQRNLSNKNEMILRFALFNEFFIVFLENEPQVFISYLIHIKMEGYMTLLALKGGKNKEIIFSSYLVHVILLYLIL